jgi:hypothetical protein
MMVIHILILIELVLIVGLVVSSCLIRDEKQYDDEFLHYGE